MLPNNINPLVSVIVPCYNVEKYLQTCIQSVLHQTYSKWELILVDDGSPDRSGQICDKYASDDNRIKVVHKTNGGLSSARNAGLDIMKGEYVTFLDADDFLHYDFLKTLVSLAIQNYADIAQCDFVRGTSTVYPEVDNPNKISIYDNHSIFTSYADKVVVWGKLYNTALFNDIRMPEGLIHEDDWTTWKLYYRANKIVITSQHLYYYTYNAGSIMGACQKTPDFTYFGAYIERITFFFNKKEFDLEVISRIHWCKSLLLMYLHRTLNKQQKMLIKEKFDENWKCISHSNIVPVKLQILFYCFHYAPLFVVFMLLCMKRFLNK